VRTNLMTLAAVVLVSAIAFAQDAVYKPGAGVTAPVLTKRVNPQYTDGAMRLKVQGVVKLAIVVKADGAVGDDVRVVTSLDDELDQQAILAVKQWEFKPGTKDGHAVAVQVSVELSFKLK